MEDQRARAAMARIDRALNRIEAALSAASGDRQELERVRNAHALLRDRVEAAIGDIDQMLAANGQDRA